MNAQEFIKQRAQRNAWVKFAHMDVYLRHSPHMLNGERRQCVDLANLDIPEERFQSKGEFKALVLHVAQLLPDNHYIYVENVLTPRFEQHFLKNGWTRDSVVGIGGTPCFYISAYQARQFYK